MVHAKPRWLTLSELKELLTQRGAAFNPRTASGVTSALVFPATNFQHRISNGFAYCRSRNTEIGRSALVLLFCRIPGLPRPMNHRCHRRHIRFPESSILPRKYLYSHLFDSLPIWTICVAMTCRRSGHPDPDNPPIKNVGQRVTSPRGTRQRTRSDRRTLSDPWIAARVAEARLTRV